MPVVNIYDQVRNISDKHYCQCWVISHFSKKGPSEANPSVSISYTQIFPFIVIILVS
jgi:hypothetical protein